MTPNKKHAPRVSIIGGFSEGRHHIEHLARLLARSGFVVVKRPAYADIVIGHSGGSYLFPQDSAGKLVVMVNPPCGYGSWLGRTWRKIRQDFLFYQQQRQIRHFFRKNLWNFLYIWSRMTHNLRMAQHAREFALELPKVNARKVLVLVNKHDPWTGSMPLENLKNHRNYTFLSLEGTHDDLWTHPERYIDILHCMYER